MAVLITGATGVVGSVVRERLVDALCLSRRPSDDPRFLRGDITAPQLGLGHTDYTALTDTVSTVVHIAGEVSFTEHQARYRDINVQGTTNIADFCARARARLVYVSTAYAARADEPGFLDRGSGPSSYTASKRRAEHIVERLGSDAAIIRPSIVIGDSRTGQIVRHQALHRFAESIMLGRLPFVPAEATWLLDMIPVDVLADLIVDAVDNHVGGALVWATAGPAALTTADVVDSSLRYGWTDGDRPRMINPEAFERLIRPAFFADIPAQYHRRLDTLVSTCDQLFSEHVPFPTDMPNRYPLDWTRVIADAWDVNAQALARHIDTAAALV